MLLRILLLLVACEPFLAFEQEQGPFCWAGHDESGKDKFVPCHKPAVATNIPLLNLDSSLSAVLICRIDQCVTVSRAQLSKAFEVWQQDAKRAKP
jgi:hypothetical protein